MKRTLRGKRHLRARLPAMRAARAERRARKLNRDFLGQFLVNLTTAINNAARFLIENMTKIAEAAVRVQQQKETETNELPKITN